MLPVLREVVLLEAAVVEVVIVVENAIIEVLVEKAVVKNRS